MAELQKLPIGFSLKENIKEFDRAWGPGLNIGRVTHFRSRWVNSGAKHVHVRLVNLRYEEIAFLYELRLRDTQNPPQLIKDLLHYNAGVKPWIEIWLRASENISTPLNIIALKETTGMSQEEWDRISVDLRGGTLRLQ